MEPLQGNKNKTHHKYVKGFISEFDFFVLPFTENVGHPALIYVEENTLSSVIETNMTLASSNVKLFKAFKL